MLASEVIKNLTDLMNKYGDLRVVDEMDKSFGDFEFNQDGGDDVFVFDLTNSDNE